jgi:hypothetical protein
MFACRDHRVTIDRVIPSANGYEARLKIGPIPRYR